ncbi:MAG: lysophospholipid acyltransferase family protein [Peptococcaceae bacterium]|nr:1-acyl-sn-glycerol-3-phosphate acyltransferase [Peptococcaceae bacterium]MDH7525938.1 lysophospholipid acyltransferase family protein [Peptococcaceae bacterium]
MFYRFARGLLRLLIALFNRWEVEGLGNMPSSGPVVLAANHVSYWDPPVMGCSVDRIVHFMAKEELFHMPFLKWVLPHLQCFPVKRKVADKNALRTALRYLEKGEVLGIFPEGTRSRTGEMLPFEQGAALIALKAGAPIVPMGLIGTRTAFPATIRGRIKVRIGKPIQYPELYGAKLKSEDLERVCAELAARINDLLKEA